MANPPSSSGAHRSRVSTQFSPENSPTKAHPLTPPQKGKERATSSLTAPAAPTIADSEDAASLTTQPRLLQVTSKSSYSSQPSQLSSHGSTTLVGSEEPPETLLATAYREPPLPPKPKTPKEKGKERAEEELAAKEAAYRAYKASEPTLIQREQEAAHAAAIRRQEHEAAAAARREKQLAAAVAATIASVKREQEAAEAADAAAAAEAAAPVIEDDKFDVRDYTKHPLTVGEKAGRRPALVPRMKAVESRAAAKWRMRKMFLIVVPIAVVCVLVATIAPAVYFTLRKNRENDAATVTAFVERPTTTAGPPVSTTVPEAPVSTDDSGFELQTGSWLVFARKVVGAPGVVNKHPQCTDYSNFDLMVRYEKERKKYNAKLGSFGLDFKDLNCPAGGKGVARVVWVQHVKGCEPAEYVTLEMDTRDSTLVLDQ